jgi:predicted porin
MKRHNLLFAVPMTLTVMALPLAAAAEGPAGGKLYGKINLTMDRVDDENDLAPLTDIEEWQLNSNASRIGVKGEMEINPGLAAIYQLEWEVSVDGDGADLTARNRYLGLKGGFGTILGGKHDTPTKLAQHKIDLFNDLTGDIKNTFEGENRANDIVVYTSPDFGFFSAAFAFIPGEGEVSEGSSDVPTGDDLADGLSIAAQYTTETVIVALAIDRDVDGQDLERLVGQFQFGNFMLGSMLQQNENDAGTVDETGVFVSGAYTLGSNVFKAQAGIVENDAGDSEEETLSLGYDRKLAKSTKAFTYVTRNVDTDDLGNEEKDTVFGVGLEHKF